MPYLRLPGSVSLYYSIITSDDASDASSKPWLVVLCPVLADECSRIPQVQEPRLRAAYNILCIDLRSQGRSRPTIKPSYDTFVAAADVAFVMEALQIPPAYIFAPGIVSFPVGVKLALLFPSQVRGLAFAGTPHMWGTPAGLSSFMEIDRSWMLPQDLEDFEEAMEGLHHSFTGGLQHGPVGEPAHTHAVDEAMGVIVRRYSPRHAPTAFEFITPIHHHSRLTPEAVASITVPVLLMQDDFSDTFSAQEAADCKNAFSGSVDFEHRIIEGGSPMMWLSHAEQVTAHLTDFLLRQAPSHPSPNTLQPLDLGYALSTLARLTGEDRILIRNPHDTESYSALSNEDKAARAAHLEVLKKSASECRLRIPGAKDLETWEIEAQPATARPRRRWRYSRRHDERPQRGDSLRASVAERISVAVEKERQEDYELESESGGSTCSSLSHPPTPLTHSPPISWVHLSKPLPAEPFESLAPIRI